MIADRRGTWTSADQRHWRKLREFVLERDEHTCQLCGRRAKTVARVDFDGDEFEPTNLRAECKSCIGHRAHERGNPTPRPYPTAETIKNPNGPRSPRQAFLIRQLGGDPEGLTRAEATIAIQALIADGREQLHATAQEGADAA
jgi:hypothetical protein